MNQGLRDPGDEVVALVNEQNQVIGEASRELKEELGISAKFTFLFDFKFTDSHSSVWGRAYHCIYDGELILQSEEIENGIYVPPPEAIQLSIREPFTPDGVYVLRRYMGLVY